MRGNKPWAITAYLALADAPVPRARLISLLFDGAQDPAGALRWNLGQVRRLLGRPGALSGPLVSLPGDGPVRFDVDVLAAARWQDAVQLGGLGGELLEGMQFPGCAAFETWLIGERRRFAALTEAALQEATLNALSVGSPGDGVGYASRLVTLNPLAGPPAGRRPPRRPRAPGRGAADRTDTCLGRRHGGPARAARSRRGGHR